MKYSRIIQAFQSVPWAILPSKLAEMRAFLEFKAAGGSITEADIREQFGDDDDDIRQETVSTGSSTVAVIPIVGVLARRMSMMTRASGGTSLAAVSQALSEAVSATNVRSIVLDIDSPGGEVMGITELHADILKARRTKPVTAYVSGMAASAAYHLASAAGEITATASALVGSIGVMGVHIEESKAMEDAGVGVTLKTAGKFKADASGLVPLSAEGAAELQRQVDTAYSVMIRDIAKGRRLPVAQVRKDFGDARILDAQLALSIGMVDAVETFDKTLARAGSGKSLQPSKSKVSAAVDGSPYVVAVQSVDTFTGAPVATVDSSVSVSAVTGEFATADDASNSDNATADDTAIVSDSTTSDDAAGFRARLALRVKADSRRSR